MIRALALRALRAWEPSPAVWDRFLSLLFPRLFWPGHIQQRLLARVFHCAASDQLSKNLKGLCGSKSERRCPALLLSYPLELLSWPPLFEKLEILEISCRDLQDKLRSTELKFQISLLLCLTACRSASSKLRKFQPSQQVCAEC